MSSEIQQLKEGKAYRHSNPTTLSIKIVKIIKETDVDILINVKYINDKGNWIQYPYSKDGTDTLLLSKDDYKNWTKFNIGG